MRSVLPLSLVTACALVGVAAPAAEAARPTAEVLEVAGRVDGRPAGSDAYGRLAKGDRVPYGARVRAAADSQAKLRFADGTLVRVHAESEVLVRPRPAKSASGVVVFFGRVWSKVVKSVSGETTFEVESANAVAGVRGTEFEVGVADDGSTRVIVTEGVVAVGGDSGGDAQPIAKGFAIEGDGRGRLGRRQRAPKDPNWAGWFSKRARVLEKRGLKIAKDLHGRLDRRRAKVKALVDEQRALRQQIEALERRRAGGADVRGQLEAKLSRLQTVTARLEDMKDRLQAAFGMFERWGEVAEGEQMSLLAADVKRVASEFADLVEEGTDLSEEGMDDMMKDMKKGHTLDPKDSVKDDLF